MSVNNLTFLIFQYYYGRTFKGKYGGLLRNEKGRVFFSWVLGTDIELVMNILDIINRFVVPLCYLS